MRVLTPTKQLASDAVDVLASADVLFRSSETNGCTETPRVTALLAGGSPSTQVGAAGTLPSIAAAGELMQLAKTAAEAVATWQIFRVCQFAGSALTHMRARGTGFHVQTNH